MDTFMPGFTQVLEYKEKIIPLASTACAKGKHFIEQRKLKKMTEAESESIPMANLPAKDVSTPIDHVVSDDGEAQRHRVLQLLNANTSRALVVSSGQSVPPKFPNELPARPKKAPANRWKFGFWGMVLLFIAAVTPLTTLLVRRTQAIEPATSTSAATAPAREQQVSTVTQTVTETLTNYNTSISTTTQYTVSFETMTAVSFRTATYTESKIAKSTAIGTDCDNNEVFQATKFCVFVTQCTEAKLDVKQNDCKDFCKQPKCRKADEGLMSSQLLFCCGHCGCL